MSNITEWRKTEQEVRLGQVRLGKVMLGYIYLCMFIYSNPLDFFLYIEEIAEMKG